MTEDEVSTFPYLKHGKVSAGADEPADLTGRWSTGEVGTIEQFRVVESPKI